MAQVYSIHAAVLLLLEKVEWDVGAVSYPCLNDFLALSEKEISYQLLDSLLGVMLSQVPDDCVIHLVSSHSYQRRADEQLEVCDQGFWVMSGASVLQDQLIAGGHVLDLAPTIWALRGEAPLAEMAQKPRLDLLSEEVPVFPREDECEDESPRREYRLPWADLLQDGRVPKLLRPDQLSHPDLIQRIWRESQVGEFRSLQQMEKVEEACIKGETLLESFPNDFLARTRREVSDSWPETGDPIFSVRGFTAVW